MALRINPPGKLRPIAVTVSPGDRWRNTMAFSGKRAQGAQRQRDAAPQPASRYRAEDFSTQRKSAARAEF
jgi:hypothetical protein